LISRADVEGIEPNFFLWRFFGQPHDFRGW